MKNQNELDKLLDNLVIRAENEVDRIYARRLRNILDEISLMYEKYEVDGTLTLAEMSNLTACRRVWTLSLVS
jgi:hypothetical protein